MIKYYLFLFVLFIEIIFSQVQTDNYIQSDNYIHLDNYKNNTSIILYNDDVNLKSYDHVSIQFDDIINRLDIIINRLEIKINDREKYFNECYLENTTSYISDNILNYLFLIILGITLCVWILYIWTIG